MRLSSVLGFRKRRIRNRIVTLGIVISGMLSVAFAIITFYGQNAGNFVISIDEAGREIGIIISEDPSFSEELTRLMTDPIDEARDMTYSWLKIEEVEATNGNYEDPDHNYVAYTFYLQNSGLETVDITYYIRITEATRNIDHAIRVLVIEEGVQTMYMMEDRIDLENPPFYPEIMPESVPFMTDHMVMRKTFTNFKPGQIKKFSVLVWLEGYDPDTIDDIIGGRIRMAMNFTVNTFD
ncbi:MAG: hypothetical protein RBT45_01580 [Acholeplasmataceae bacterium]|jgi:hypothetical protein|nr:hypothetical protein [Acholeplasmataceae bacterium]